jgi:predicted RNA-binding Zn-ribbon protein involved in translation (DUF1610 family)
LQAVWIKEKETKYHCCDCGKKLVSRAKTPYWRSTPADQKRCRSCSMKYRMALKRLKKQNMRQQDNAGQGLAGNADYNSIQPST